MHIGVPMETKVHEYRVGLTPAAVRELTDTGHTVSVQSGAGLGIGFAACRTSASPPSPSETDTPAAE